MIRSFWTSGWVLTVRILRFRHGEIDAREAYVDLLILKAVGNAAGTPLEIWVAEPEIDVLTSSGLGTEDCATARDSAANSINVTGLLALGKGREGNVVGGCSTSGGSAPLGLAMVLLAALAIRRRRIAA